MGTIGNILSFVLYQNKEQTIIITISNILIIILVYVSLWFFFKFIYRLVDRKVEEENKAKVGLIISFARYFIISIVFIFTLDAMGIKVTALLFGSTAIFVGLGFGMQRLFQDIISGILILIDKSIHVDDIIEVDGMKGKVFEINLRTTRLNTRENKVIIIPNHKFLDDSVYNWTQNGYEIRESLTVGVAYGSPLNLVREVLLQTARNNSEILDDPAPYVLFEEFNSSSLDFKLIFSTEEVFNSEMIKSELRFEIDAVFREHNISIPFPQRDIHLINPKQ